MITNNTTVEQAIAEAQRIFPGADVISIELEDEDGVLYWRVRLDGGREVLVEDADGNALDFGPTGSTSVDGVSFRDRDDDDDDDDNGDDDRDDRDDRDDDDDDDGDDDDDRDDRRDDDDDDDNNDDDDDDDGDDDDD